MNVACPLGHARHKKEPTKNVLWSLHVVTARCQNWDILRHPQIQELMMFLGPLGGNPLWFLIGTYLPPKKTAHTSTWQNPSCRHRKWWAQIGYIAIYSYLQGDSKNWLKFGLLKKTRYTLYLYNYSSWYLNQPSLQGLAEEGRSHCLPPAADDAEPLWGPAGYRGDMGMSENGVYSQWNNHLVGIMISKTIGCRGTNHFQTNPYRCVYSSTALCALCRTPGWPSWGTDTWRRWPGNCLKSRGTRRTSWIWARFAPWSYVVAMDGESAILGP